MLERLKTLSELYGVSGNETRVRAYLRRQVEPYADEVFVDPVGNLYAHKRGSGPRVMLAAHMDEVGMIVRGITDAGTLLYDAGGIDPRVVVSKRVSVGPNDIPGVIGAKAIHLQSWDEMKRVLPHENLYIEIGAKDKASAERLVSPGDYICFDSDWVEFGDALVKARALDDRVGCNCMLSILEGDYPCDVTCAFTVQEEIGCRGAMVAGWNIKADCVIALEGTAANDTGMEDECMKVCRVGEGVAISFMDRGTIAHRGLYKRLREVAQEAGVRWQVKKFVSGSNDARYFQNEHGALAAAVLSVPCRYIHSPSNVASFHDIEAQYQLVDAFLAAGGTF